MFVKPWEMGHDNPGGTDPRAEHMITSYDIAPNATPHLPLAQTRWAAQAAMRVSPNLVGPVHASDIDETFIHPCL